MRIDASPSSIRRSRQVARVHEIDGMADREKLKVYDLLREAHKSIKLINKRGLLANADKFERGIVDAVDIVLYMAEGKFARMSK